MDLGYARGFALQPDTLPVTLIKQVKPAERSWRMQQALMAYEAAEQAAVSTLHCHLVSIHQYPLSWSDVQPESSCRYQLLCCCVAIAPYVDRLDGQQFFCITVLFQICPSTAQLTPHLGGAHRVTSFGIRQLQMFTQELLQ